MGHPISDDCSDFFYTMSTKKYSKWTQAILTYNRDTGISVPREGNKDSSVSCLHLQEYDGWKYIGKDQIIVDTQTDKLKVDTLKDHIKAQKIIKVDTLKDHIKAPKIIKVDTSKDHKSRYSKIS